MDDLVLDVRNLSKKFLIKNDGVLRPSFVQIIRAILGFPYENGETKKDFWALRDVSFNLKRGESVGIVGMNGAGKSTLLKVLLNRLIPDEGSVDIDGNAGGLIELGAGFHPEQTGRKNIAINAKILGASEREIDEKMSRIIEFSELGEFIDMPVKTYSSGMSVRLGFSVAIHFVKDLIILDEVLAVGDFEFRQKCHRKIHELKKDRSFVLVSHSTRDVALFCDKAIFLHKGRVVKYGDTETVLKGYAKVKRDHSFEEILSLANRDDDEKKPSKQTVEHHDILKYRNFMESEDYRVSRFGRLYRDDSVIDALAVRCNQPIIDGEIEVGSSDRFELHIAFNLKVDVAHIRIGLPMFSENGDMLVGPDSRKLTSDKADFAKAGVKEVTVEFETFPLNEGRFYLVLAVNNDPGFLMREHLVWVNVKNYENLFGLVKTKEKWKGKAT